MARAGPRFATTTSALDTWARAGAIPARTGVCAPLASITQACLVCFLQRLPHRWPERWSGARPPPINLAAVYSPDAPQLGVNGVETFCHVKLLALSVCNIAYVQRAFRQLTVKTNACHGLDPAFQLLRKFYQIFWTHMKHPVDVVTATRRFKLPSICWSAVFGPSRTTWLVACPSPKLLTSHMAKNVRGIFGGDPERPSADADRHIKWPAGRGGCAGAMQQCRSCLPANVV